MSHTTHVEFVCTKCAFRIVGDYEFDEDDVQDYCPKCGHLNMVPRTVAAPAVVVDAGQFDEPPPPSKPAVATPIPNRTVTPPLKVADRTPSPSARPDERVTPPAHQAAPAAFDSPAPSEPPKPAAPAKSNPIPLPRRPDSRVAWEYRPEGMSKSSPALRNGIAVDDGGRIIAALGRTLVALAPRDDRVDVVWTFAVGDVIPGSPVIGANGTIFAHSSDGLLHALTQDGKPARPPTKVGPALGWATPLVDAAGQVWISGSTGGLLRVDEAGQTTPRLFFRSASRFDCTGLLRQGSLYIGAEDQHLHAVDIQGDKGRDRWDQRTNVGLTGWYLNSAIAWAEGSLIIAVSRDDRIWAFREDGSVAWNTAVGRRVLGSPVVLPEGLVVVGFTTETLRGGVAAFQSSTGQPQWQCDLPHPVEATPVVGDAGQIYVGDNAGGIHAIDGSGTKLWTEHTQAAVRSAGALLPSGQVVFGTDEGSLAAVRCDSTQLAAGWPKLLATAANRCPTR